jgi:hypothetical protein
MKPMSLFPNCMRFAIVAWALLAAPPARAEGPTIASGAYEDGMLIGFDPATRIVSGYFEMQRGERPSFNCIFFLAGKLEAARAEIMTYFPETPTADLIRGELMVESPKQFRVRLETEHGGCGNVEHFADKDQPAEFTLGAAYPWISIAVVRSDRAFFHDAPSASTRRRAYVVKGDGLGVRASEPGWLEVDYVGGEKPVSGWIRRVDVYD